MNSPSSRPEGPRPKRLYVVMGEPWQPFVEPAYTTDPRFYNLSLFDPPISDEEFEREHRHRIKAFKNREHAISFAYHCNLVSVRCPVYDCVHGAWLYNDTETGKVAEDIN